MNTNNIGLPNNLGTYTYNVNDGKVLLPLNNLTPFGTIIEPKNQVINEVKKEINIVQILINIFLIGLILGGLYYLYRRITIVASYIDASIVPSLNKLNNLDTTVQNAVSNTYNQKILDSQTTIQNNLLNQINNTIIPKIYSDAGEAFISNDNGSINLSKGFPMISKNTLVCDNIKELGTCSCLFDNCDQLSTFKNVVLIDRPFGFDNTSGKVISGNIIPIAIDSLNRRITNQFSLSFFINITKTVPENRILFHWAGDNNVLNRYPSIIIRGNSETDYGGKYRNSLELRFSNLGNDGIFNTTGDIRGNCIENIPLYTWTHVLIQANGKNIDVYINGFLSKQILTQYDVRIGDQDQWIFLGKPFNDNLANPYGILLARMRWFSQNIPIDYIQFFVNEYINK